jgi:RNA polymerase sigma factor (sigma-70 family)
MLNRREAEPGAGEASPMDDRDKELEAALAAGRLGQAFTVLMGLHGDRVYRYCLGMLGSSDEAADALQTTFKQVFVDLPRFQRRGTFKAWVLNIARNRCLDELRRRRRWGRLIARGTDVVDRAPEGGSPDERGPDEELRAPLEECLRRLPPEARDCLLMRFGQDLAYEDLARIREESSGAIRVRVSRALASLRACLAKKGVLP